MWATFRTNHISGLHETHPSSDRIPQHGEVLGLQRRDIDLAAGTIGVRQKFF